MTVQTMGQILITAAAVVIGTMTTRFLPFIVFPPSRETPKYVQYLGSVLPFAVIGLLVVFCLKDISYRQLFMPNEWAGIGSIPGITEAISIVCIFILHRWKRNTLISIGAGTILYMILVQFIFTNS